MQAVDEFRSAAEKARIAAEAETEARLSAEERARRGREERALWEQLSDEAEQAKLSLAAQLQMLHAAAAAAPPQATAAIIAQAEVAAAAIDIDEASTRTLIDAHVRARSREVDTLTLRHSCGVRPAKGSNTAIAEWPTKSGPADYALFVGMRCIAVVEAKRKNKNVSAFIGQAQRYSRGFRFKRMRARLLSSPGADGLAHSGSPAGLARDRRRGGADRTTKSAGSPPRLHCTPFANLYLGLRERRNQPASDFAPSSHRPSFPVLTAQIQYTGAHS